jgi:hypothetical protein
MTWQKDIYNKNLKWRRMKHSLVYLEMSVRKRFPQIILKLSIIISTATEISFAHLSKVE